MIRTIVETAVNEGLTLRGREAANGGFVCSNASISQHHRVQIKVILCTCLDTNVVRAKACPEAEVHMALAANVVGSLTLARLAAALLAVAILCCELGAVNAGCRTRRGPVASVLSRLVIERKLLQQFMHELFPKAQLPWMLLRSRKGLEGGGRQVSVPSRVCQQRGRWRVVWRV